LNKNPNHPDILSDRGVVYIHLNRKEDALKAFDLSLNLQPDYAYRYSSRAYARAFFGDIDAAIKDYEKAVELDKEDAIAYNNLGLLLEQKGRMDLAKKNFDRADHLAKIEEKLLNVVDELEEDGIYDEVQIQRKEIEPIEKRKKELTTWGEMKKIFTSKDQFKDFLHFIKNGFKNK
jgi:tetratricopeptide (TPR) repeat protein